MIDLFIFIIILSVFVYLLSENIKLRQTSKKLIADLFSEVMEKSIISQQLKEELSRQNIVGNEDFVKFISESRDSAYKYIEDVQAGISEFIKNVEREINHFDKYGEVISTPLNPTMKKISEEYKKLKKFIPEEIPND
ncbi:MAG: hypothetical protein RLZZ328_1396 [Bacteroidota bacterium]|jgi:hypothetical protein